MVKRGKGMALDLSNRPLPIYGQRTRSQLRSVLGLYDAIANGIDGTGMAAFSQLTEAKNGRWLFILAVCLPVRHHHGSKLSGYFFATINKLLELYIQRAACRATQPNGVAAS